MSARVVIVGAGVIGLCTAYYCARRGFDVTVVERGEAGSDGASHGNAGMIVPSHFIPLAAPGMVALGLKWMWNPASPFYIKPRLDPALIDWAYKFWRAATPERVKRAAPVLARLSMESRACFQQLAALPGPDFRFEKKGLLMLCQTRHALDEEARTAAKARELDLEAEVLDATQAAALNPGATMAIAGAIYYPSDCHLDPARFMAALHGQLSRLGVKFRRPCEAAGFRTENHRLRALLLVGGEEIEADEFVLCGGTWTPDLATSLGLRLPMQAGKGYSLTLPNPRRQLAIPSILAEARVAVTPMGVALRVGGTMEIAGRDLTINPVRVRGIIDSFCRYFPDYRPEDFDAVRPWSGLRPCSPDGLPYVGRTSKYTNLSLAAGHAMMGVSLAPITGRVLADTLAGEAPPDALHLFSPDRY